MHSRISILHTTKIINHQSLLTSTRVSSTNTNFFIFFPYHLLTILNTCTKNQSGISDRFFTINYLMYPVTSFLISVVSFACLLTILMFHIAGTQACINKQNLTVTQTMLSTSCLLIPCYKIFLFN